MGIFLRLDIDKPYGRSNLPTRIISKVREDYWFPAWSAAGYLRELAGFLEFLNGRKIPAFSYHRLCTFPSREVVRLLRAGGHKFGLHAENTRSVETLGEEVAQMKARVPELPLHSFTKHGNGELKLGRYHYPPFEPTKYLSWGETLDLPFYFGNGIASAVDFANDAPSESASPSTSVTYYPNMFWLEPGYQTGDFTTVEQALAAARRAHLVLIIHPENLRAIKKVRDDFTAIVDGAQRTNIPFLTEV